MNSTPEVADEERSRYAKLSDLIKECEAAFDIQAIVTGIVKDFCGQLIDAFLSKPRQGHTRKARSRKARRRMQRRWYGV